MFGHLTTDFKLYRSPRKDSPSPPAADNRTDRTGDTQAFDLGRDPQRPADSSFSFDQLGISGTLDQDQSIAASWSLHDLWENELISLKFDV